MKSRLIQWCSFLSMATAIILVAETANAHTVIEQTEICPICQTEFQARLAGSGTQFGMRLDMKPLGPIEAPWPVAVCPKCHFVLFDDELPDAELVIVKEYVKTKEYQEWAKTRASYYLMAKLFSALGRDDYTLGFVYLQASWEEEDQDEFMVEDLRLSLSHFESYLKTLSDSVKKGPESEKDDESVFELETVQILKGELLRRLGKYEEAKAYFKRLQTQATFQNNYFEQITYYELYLCQEKDSSPHKMPSESDNEPDIVYSADGDKLYVRYGLVYKSDSNSFFTGTVVGYWPSGQKKSEIEVRDGMQHGKALAWYEDGQKKSEIGYRDGKEHGKKTEWYVNGMKLAEGEFCRGKKLGKYNCWYPSGQKSYETEYRNGQRVSYKEWDEEGKLIKDE